MKGKLSALLYNVLLIYRGTKADDNIATNLPIELTVSDFDSRINDKSHLVMFYAPWCGHCKNLQPLWEKYAATQNIESDLVAVSRVDCTQHTSLCARHEVNGYPTIKLFKKGSTSGIKYKGSRDIDSFNAFVNEHLNITEEPVEPELDSGLIEHTEETFAEKAKTGFNFIKFYAPWCGHCQNLAPTWEALGAEFKKNAAVSIGKVDCTQFKSLCNEYEIKSYPTLLWLLDGKIVEKFTGERTLQGLSEFVNENVKSDKAAVPNTGTVQSAVITLNYDNFEKEISSGFTLVKFFAPWCGHCKRLAPTYEELANKFEGNNAVKIASIDCTHNLNREYCSRQSINGFPSLFLYKDGEKIGEHDGDRALDNLVTFIKVHILSHEEL